jgi:hypothetical protein
MNGGTVVVHPTIFTETGPAALLLLQIETGRVGQEDQMALKLTPSRDEGKQEGLFHGRGELGPT